MQSLSTVSVAVFPLIVAGKPVALPVGSPLRASVEGDWIVVRGAVAGVEGSQTLKPGAASKYLRDVPSAAASAPAPSPVVTGGTTEVRAAGPARADGGISFSGMAIRGERSFGAESRMAKGVEGAPRGGDAPMTTLNFTDRDAIVHNEDVMRPLGSVEEVINKAGLNWTVSAHPLFMADAGNMVSVPAQSILRDDTREVLGVVGPKYVPVQNAEGFKLLDQLKSAGAEFVGAGSFKAGGTVFVQMDLKAARDIVKGDEVRAYIIVRNSHDGTGSYVVKSTPVRAVCYNTLTHATFGEGALFGRLRHTKGSVAKIGDIAQLILGLRKQQEAAFDTYAALAARPVTDKVVREVFESIGVFQLPEEPEAVKARDNANARRDEVLRLFNGEGKGARMEGVAGTAWGLYNAVTEFADWSYAAGSRSDDNRNESRLVGRAAGVKEDALEIIAQAVGVDLKAARA